jgi:hypothetical protein
MQAVVSWRAGLNRASAAHPLDPDVIFTTSNLNQDNIRLDQKAPDAFLPIIVRVSYQE